MTLPPGKEAIRILFYPPMDHVHDLLLDSTLVMFYRLQSREKLGEGDGSRSRRDMGAIDELLDQSLRGQCICHWVWSLAVA